MSAPLLWMIHAFVVIKLLLTVMLIAGAIFVSLNTNIVEDCSYQCDTCSNYHQARQMGGVVFIKT